MELLKLELACANRVHQQCDVYAAEGQPFVQHAGEALGDGDSGMRKAASERLHEQRRQHARHARRQADHHAPARVALEFVQRAERAGDAAQNSLAVLEKTLPGRRQLDATAVAVQQRLVQLDLEVADLAAQ